MSLRMTRERMLEITAECDKYEIKLANDPASLGPTYLQDMIANCRNFTNHTTRLLNEVHRSKMTVHLELRRKQTAFKIASDELLATNPIVRNLPNIKDRESQINIMLRDEHREIMNLENDDLELEHIEDYVRRRHRELKDTMREIQTQRNLIKDDAATGSMFGDERPTSMGGPADAAFQPGAGSRPDGMDEEDIERMLQGQAESPVETPEGEPAKAVEKSSTEPAEPAPVVVASAPEPPPPPPVVVEPPPPPPPPAPAPRSEEDEIRAFLDTSRAVQTTVPDDVIAPGVHPAVSEDDYAEILGNL